MPRRHDGVLLQMLNDGRLRFEEAARLQVRSCLVLSIEGLGTAMRLSTMRMPAFEVGCSRRDYR
ncbi:hypothetical protein BAE36_33340 [Rhizobium leguminosarum bv. trifolii]|nr:hypothetical protein BAE36_33340 [Rhizobium leguminosarum bv. trifolii]